MKKIVPLMVCIAIVFSLTACGKKEEIELNPKEVYDLLDYNCSTYVRDDNFVSGKYDEEKGVVIVILKNISKEKQEEFIQNVFSISTGSTYITNLKEQSILVFEESE